jgi:hypothetical protein
MQHPRPPPSPCAFAPLGARAVDRRWIEDGPMVDQWWTRVDHVDRGSGISGGRRRAGARRGLRLLPFEHPPARRQLHPLAPVVITGVGIVVLVAVTVYIASDTSTDEDREKERCKEVKQECIAGGGEIHGERGFANAALLIEDRDRETWRGGCLGWQGCPPRRSRCHASLGRLVGSIGCLSRACAPPEARRQRPGERCARDGGEPHQGA